MLINDLPRRHQLDALLKKKEFALLLSASDLQLQKQDILLSFI